MIKAMIIIIIMMIVIIIIIIVIIELLAFQQPTFQKVACKTHVRGTHSRESLTIEIIPLL